MSIFCVIETEPKVQVGDKTRLDASKSYVAGETITKIEIKPSASDSYLDTGTSGIADWQYPTAGTQTVTVKVTTTETPAGVTATRAIVVVSEADDNLFSTDDRLRVHEPDILKWVTAGRATFKDVHRRAQELVLNWFNTKGFRKSGGVKIAVADVSDIAEVGDWATFLALRLIFEGISNAIDDQFSVKAKKYKGLEVASRDSGEYKFDLDGDSELEESEKINTWTGSLKRS